MTERNELDEQRKPGPTGQGFYLGTNVYRLRPGIDVDTMDIVDAWDEMVDANLVTVENNLQDGDRLLIQGLLSLHVGVVSRKNSGALTCTSKVSQMLFMLAWGSDRNPARWVCVGQAHLAGVTKLSL